MLTIKRNKKIIYFIVYVVLFVAVVAAIFPVAWMILTSFKTRVQIFSIPPTFTFKPTLGNYQETAAAVLPFYLILKTFHLLDTHAGLILVYTVFNLAFVIWMMRSFFDEIPRELDEASMIDGCSRLGSLIKVIFPLSAPGFVATAVFCMIFSWNEFYFALILTGTRARTLPVAATGLITPSETLWGLICSIGTFMFIPLLIFAWFLQRYLLRGLTFGAIK
ncbi:MAG: carbohydrate ABC transporter permease [Candidatus Atribacteria bacterium]|nr:carbohydrate ABC transporter permease [Candidatus Atribacteria bacterium]